MACRSDERTESALQQMTPRKAGRIVFYKTATSRRAESVVTGRVIRRLRIAEAGRATRESDSGQRRPDGIVHIRATFNYDGLTTSPINIESELICLKAVVRSLN